MFPVVDPNVTIFQLPFFKALDIHAIMTNAYLLRRGRGGDGGLNVHKFLGFEETVATDSGAYQILEYGRVGVDPEEIVRYQEEIDTDIGVILDVPTGHKSEKSRARWTVDETIRRADRALAIRTRNDILWVGPVQGGIHLPEVARSAKQMARRDFAIYALGSPTQIMESQRFDILVDMIVSAKKELPLSKPLHLFGAGHPALFPFLVAVGCDLFDSAAYALYARSARYITSEGTTDLRDMEEFPCLCDACRTTTPRELLRSKGEMEKALTYHNLQACFTELRRIRDAIRKGRLWDLLEQRAHSHPSLRKCFARLSRYSDVLERSTPVAKPRGIFYLGAGSDLRPEMVRHGSRIDRVHFPRNQRLLLLPGRWRRPYREDPKYRTTTSKFQDTETVQVIFYSLAFGAVPLELDETYPIAQTEIWEPSPGDSTLYVKKARAISRFLRRLAPQAVILVRDGPLGESLESELRTSLQGRRLLVIDGGKLGRGLGRIETLRAGT